MKYEKSSIYRIPVGFADEISKSSFPFAYILVTISSDVDEMSIEFA